MPALHVDDVVGLWGADADARSTPAHLQTEPWIQFDEHGFYRGFDGCRLVGGSWCVDVVSRTITVEKFGAVGLGAGGKVPGWSQERTFTSMTVESDRLVYRLGAAEPRSLTRRR
ncbi:hypothetical protein [Aeromicrobium fastidiosum]|uniref:Uncharacterized protein n=1 Tax=Aeromicrobium fastidiosum TaxID=52699 RepID=A0A641AQA3_9ACTN|nr:hypothetical protein [Aeromicrobium fastidiosum]KAA1380284.1 hypothetical protein ESP62_003555 [Aeromicrobium fastidiosum]MBP2389837.1 hypothetical protein [Aeromicrobium fastidiosum]